MHFCVIHSSVAVHFCCLLCVRTVFLETKRTTGRVCTLHSAHRTKSVFTFHINKIAFYECVTLNVRLSISKAKCFARIIFLRIKATATAHVYVASWGHLWIFWNYTIHRAIKSLATRRTLFRLRFSNTSIFQVQLTKSVGFDLPRPNKKRSSKCMFSNASQEILCKQ